MLLACWKHRGAIKPVVEADEIIMPRQLELINQKFGRLTVTKKTFSVSGKTHWECLCDCGSQVTVVGSDLKNGNTRSCGCLKIDLRKQRVTHGFTGTKIYHVWFKMNQRCDRMSDPAYKNYGGRGILVCDRWNRSNPEGFQNFLDDMGLPAQGMTIERIDNNSNYDPSNCKWATRLEQNRNVRSNVYLTFEGETHILEDWAKILGVSKSTLHSRIKAKWNIERILAPKTTKKKV